MDEEYNMPGYVHRQWMQMGPRTDLPGLIGSLNEQVSW